MVTPDIKKIRKWYDQYIAREFLYRIIPEYYLDEIKKKGFTPDKNPFQKQKSLIKQFFKILLKLHTLGFIMMRWWGKPVDQKQVIETTLTDLNAHYIDFTPASKISYYQNLQGGALAQTLYIYSEELLMKRPKLSDKEWNLVKKINEWAKKLCQCQNKVIAIKASSPYLEHAYFQYFTGTYVESPFGRFEHFAQVIAKHALHFYKPYLTGKKLFYLRTKKHIPASEIVRIR